MANENYYVARSIVDGSGAWLQVIAHDMASIKGYAYQILVRCPAGAAPEGGWPVAYTLDHSLFNALDPALAPRGVLVGVGYDGQDQRVRDYTPLMVSYGVSPSTQPPDTGGADDFLAFLLQKLKPWVQASYPIDTSRQSLIGHSLGALFGLHTFFQCPAAFQTYLLSSPSVWWADHFLLKAARHAVNASSPNPPIARARIAITVGEYEQSLSPAELERDPEYQKQQLDRRTFRRMVDGTHELAQMLEGVDAAAVSFQILKGQTHAMAGPRALVELGELIFPD